MQPQHEQQASEPASLPLQAPCAAGTPASSSLFSPSPGTKACPGSSPDHICPLSPGPARAPPTGLNLKGDLVLKKEDLSPFSSSEEPKEQLYYRSLPPPGGPALDVPSVAAGQGHAGSHVPALTAWGQGGSYTHSTALTHTRHHCQSSNTINEP